LEVVIGLFSSHDEAWDYGWQRFGKDDEWFFVAYLEERPPDYVTILELE
jgi:hypothetical protein